jgi:hypothetical protein
MLHAFTFPPGRRLRQSVLALLAIFVGTSCDSTTDPVATSTLSDPPTAATTDTAAATDSLAPALATSSYSGLPFGPFGLWSSATSVYWGPSPFTGSHNYTDAGNIVTQIGAARNKKQRLILAMTGGSSGRYLTNGKFDFTKWKNKMNTFKTTAIKNAVAAGVADGTIIGNTVMDEPETKQWGGVMTKTLLDQMAAYVKAIFPTLAVGVNHGPTGYYLWRPTERYRVVDYVLNQYNWWITTGNVTAWRDKVLAQAKLDGVRPAFSINILGGGVQDRSGTWDCTGSGQGGKGPYYPNCRMTPDQVRTWGRTLGVAGCAMTMWRYDDAFMSKSTNVTAFRDVASTLAGQPRQSCRRA